MRAGREPALNTDAHAKDEPTADLRSGLTFVGQTLSIEPWMMGVPQDTYASVFRAGTDTPTFVLAVIGNAPRRMSRDFIYTNTPHTPQVPGCTGSCQTFARTERNRSGVGVVDRPTEQGPEKATGTTFMSTEDLPPGCSNVERIKQSVAEFHSPKTQAEVRRAQKHHGPRPEAHDFPPYRLSRVRHNRIFTIHRAVYSALVTPHRTTKDKVTGERVALGVDGSRGTTPVDNDAFTLTFRKRVHRNGVLQATVKGYGVVPSRARKVLRVYGRVESLRLSRVEVKCFPGPDAAHIRPPLTAGPPLPVRPDRKDTTRRCWGYRGPEYEVECYEMDFARRSRSWGLNLEARWKGDADAKDFDDIVRNAIAVLDKVRGDVELRPVASVRNRRGKRPFGIVVAAKAKRRNDEAQAAREEAWRRLKKHGRIANPELAGLFAYAGEKRWRCANDFTRRNGLVTTKDADGTAIRVWPAWPGAGP